MPCRASISISWCAIHRSDYSSRPRDCGTAGVQLSNLMGCLTTYGIGSAPPYFGAGYVPQAKWYQLGFIMSIFYIVVWLGVGGAWWKVIGLW